tara:strand:- start:92 stop:529 length:438 start_codon:yes stop_codon:yes gene_type:complete
MPIKSFRGKIADGVIDTINLHTNNGSVGYRIIKFIIMPENPGTTDFEHTIKIYKILQQTATADLDFSDNTLLAGAFTEGNNSSNYIGQPLVTFFDNEIFNQDLYVTHVDAKGALECNYYFELEQIKLDLNENTVATLKDIRNIKS